MIKILVNIFLLRVNYLFPFNNIENNSLNNLNKKKKLILLVLLLLLKYLFGTAKSILIQNFKV